MKWQMIEKMQVEFFGTYWLIFGGTFGTLVLSILWHQPIGGFMEGLIFGAIFLLISFTLGRISGCHLNPTVTIGLYFAGLMPRKEVFPYLFSQTVGGIFGIETLYLLIITFPETFSTGFMENGYGIHSSGHFTLIQVFLIEMSVLLTFVVMFILLYKRNTKIGTVFLSLTFAILYGVSRNVTNGAMNPVKSTGMALLGAKWAMKELWLFWAVSILSGILAALLYHMLHLANVKLKDFSRRYLKIKHLDKSRLKSMSMLDQSDI